MVECLAEKLSRYQFEVSCGVMMYDFDRSHPHSSQNQMILSVSFKNVSTGAGDMALPEDLRSVPSTHMVVHCHP